jgi:hypothetical protein
MKGWKNYFVFWDLLAWLFGKLSKALRMLFAKLSGK